MSYTNGLDKPTDYFNTKLYTGTGSSNAITGVGFQPDWVWIKKRSATDGSRMFDVVRGASKGLFTDSSSEEVTVSSEHTSFDSDGFSLGSSENVNESSGTFVSWNWKAGGSASSNSNGSITSSVSASTTAGFSIVSYTGTGSNATVGHGLSSAPKMIFIKNRNLTGDDAQDWSVYNKSIGAGNFLFISRTNASASNSTRFNSTDPTTSVFSLGSHGSGNGSSNTYIAYCFADVKGYSKIGSYTGNGNVDGTFVYTGFKPAFFITKRSDVANSWVMFDNTRSPFNEINNSIYANTNEAEETGTANNDVDFLSNGIKIREDNNGINASGGTYIYMAFAENPFVTSTGIPTTAR